MQTHQFEITSRVESCRRHLFRLATALWVKNSLYRCGNHQNHFYTIYKTQHKLNTIINTTHALVFLQLLQQNKIGECTTDLQKCRSCTD